MIREPQAGQVIWRDGAFVPWHDATMHICDHHYGFGVFEGVRSYATDRGVIVFRLHDHTARLFRSAKILGINVPDQFDQAQLNGVQLELLRINGLRDAYLRPFIYHGGTPGLSPRGQDLKVHVAIIALEWLGRSPSNQAGITLKTSSFIRAPNNLLFKAKANANYMMARLALQEALANGADDALLFDHNGFATEATAANFFAVRDGVVCVPVRSAALEGITRETIIALAQKAGYPVREEGMTRSDIYAADEAFLTGTAVGITPIRQFDGRSLGALQPGPITLHLQELYHNCVQDRGEPNEWITRL